MKTFGVIFDWDGVIIDSSVSHERSWERLAKEENKTLPPDHFKKGFGMRNEFIIPELLGWTKDPDEVCRLSRRKEALYREVVKEQGLTALPGVPEWLKYLQEHRIPCSIGSSTQIENISLALELLGFAPYFNAITTSEDVTKGKPDPQVFLIAARKINIPPELCVVFEDTPVGIQAARAGGMKVVAVKGSHPDEKLRDADRIVSRMDSLTIAELEKLFS